MDNTLVSFKKLKAKRRDMSLIFNNEIKMPSKYQAPAGLYSINRTKNQYTNVLVIMKNKLFNSNSKILI